MQKIIVIDYGSQYNHLISRRIRDLGVYAELWSAELVASAISTDKDIIGIILSGGPKSVDFADAGRLGGIITTLGLPILGICYGMQLLAHVFGGKVEPAQAGEYGKATLTIHDANSPLFAGVDRSSQVFMSHRDHVAALPPDFLKDASTEGCPIAAFHHRALPIFGVQFHPEVVHTHAGNQMLANFIHRICHGEAAWSMSTFIVDEVEKIKASTRGSRVLLGLSGGVDSSVTAILIARAIPDKLTCMFIDHGFLRKDEHAVIGHLRDEFALNIVVIDARERFLTKLKGITDPETKRKLIGTEFIAVFEEEAAKLGDFPFLAQGTLYTDVIESGTAQAAVIKSHHNVGGLPEKMNMKLLEPLNRLYKDEVRSLGRKLGLPEAIVSRQPFPGPGLAIRIIGEVTEEKLAIVRETDWILREEIASAGLEKAIWQYFTVLAGIRTVGVMGDARTYAHTVAIRAVTSVDGMTADWARIPYEVLDKISRRIVNEVPHVNRVVYDISSKPPATIEWE